MQYDLHLFITRKAVKEKEHELQPFEIRTLNGRLDNSSTHFAKAKSRKKKILKCEINYGGLGKEALVRD